MANETSQEMIWSQEQCRMLAQEMEKYPCLWDRRNDDYKKGGVKRDAKKAIGEKLKIPTYLVDSKIKSIISQFLREIRKERDIRNRTSGSARYKSKWFLLPDLMYILSTRENRNVRTHNPEDLCIEIQDSRESLPDTDTDGVETGEENENYRSSEGYVSATTTDFKSFADSSSKPSKRKSSLDDTLMKIVTSLASSLSKLSKQGMSPATDTNEDEWNYFSGLVAKKMRSIQNPAIRIRAENEIYSVLLRAQADDIGCPILYLNNAENTSD